MATWEEFKKTMTGELPIFEEARCGNIRALRAHLAEGGDVNLRNHRGHSLLMLASYNDEFAAARFLIRHGAEVDAADNAGNTILMGVSFKGFTRMVKLLLAAGADPSRINTYGVTACDFAKVFGRHEVVVLLSEDVANWKDPFRVAAKIVKKKTQDLVSN